MECAMMLLYVEFPMACCVEPHFGIGRRGKSTFGEPCRTMCMTMELWTPGSPAIVWRSPFGRHPLFVVLWGDPSCTSLSILRVRLLTVAPFLGVWTAAALVLFTGDSRTSPTPWTRTSDSPPSGGDLATNIHRRLRPRPLMALVHYRILCLKVRILRPERRLRGVKPGHYQEHLVVEATVFSPDRRVVLTASTRKLGCYWDRYFCWRAFPTTSRAEGI
ncbi:hypothetical protein LXA43DRAFT_193538 [Ganoderma leucocontextum]|nr:hypothetical protein LXA43DRAFT_193538 [Ganoderma leucocontextum]